MQRAPLQRRLYKQYVVKNYLDSSIEVNETREKSQKKLKRLKSFRNSTVKVEVLDSGKAKIDYPNIAFEEH
jgi:hypothetical protein